VKRLALLAFLVSGIVVGAAAQPAQATNECRGLQVCVKVSGPWVVVPPARSVPRAKVEYQLSCPRGFVVGGLDAELSDRAIDITFVGKLGSPVNPGVTTSRAAVFNATYAGAPGRTSSFRPHLGCVPSAGGGTGPVPFMGPVPYKLSAAFPPGEPTIRRMSNVRLRPLRTHATRACAGGERLISGWHAVGFYTASAPSASLLASVIAVRSFRGGRVDVQARVGTAVSGIRAVLQVGAVCGGGS
jgi:hypothetical protein